MDLDSSGTVSWQEFALMAMALHGDDWDERVLRQEFREMDVDGSGDVDRHEWESHFLRHLQSRPEADFTDTVNAVIRAAKTLRKQHTPRAREAAGSHGGDGSSRACVLGSAFDEVDRDSSGTVSWQEFVLMAKARIPTRTHTQTHPICTTPHTLNALFNGEGTAWCPLE